MTAGATAIAVLHVRRAGPLVTLQDGGRPGLLRFGVPASGPMDRPAHAAANTVLGRPVGSTAVEVSLGGLDLDCAAGAVTVAVAGGGFGVEHAGEPCGGWAVRTLRAGDRLTIRAGTWGSWCYLAVCGELQAPRWLGSTSTHVRSGLGGGTVHAGDDLVVHGALADHALDGEVEPPAGIRPVGAVRVVLGPQLECFEPGAADALIGEPYRLTTAYDRMGVRLDGPALALNDALAIASTPIVRGSLQVAGDGVATLLFADHQTTGGYPKIATAVADDVTAACQLRAGDTVRFVAVSPGQAVQIARACAGDRARHLAALDARPAERARRLGAANLIGGIFHHEPVAPPPRRSDPTPTPEEPTA